jgi:N6-L-threonylcarbamoyladenine synthase
MRILAIDTSCDETAAAITEGRKILANIIWSQASLHAKFGGVLPSLAQRMHRERIDWVIKRALSIAKVEQPEAVAVTAGPGLAIALEVGIRKARELAQQYRIPLIAVNHIEGHLLSAVPEAPEFPAMGLVISGGHTELVLIEEIGNYKIVAATEDDALGEALDKAARMLGLGYPGGALLEKLAKEGNPNHYPLPLPMAGREDKNVFSYSGLKTAMWRKVAEIQKLNSQITKQDIADLAASFQNMAFKHLIRITKRVMEKHPVKQLWVGGGVAANMELRARLRKLGREMKIEIFFPLSKRLCGDNAAMIGITAGYKAEKKEFEKNIEIVDREPRAKIDQLFVWKDRKSV